MPGVLPVQIAVCPICRSGLNLKGECVGCLLRIGLDVPSDPKSSADFRRCFGDFEIACREDGSLWELGRGAMGVTYRAMDTVLHRTVALKVIGMLDGLAKSPSIRERFLREARSAASLHHPNVAEVFQFGTSPETDQVYYAMELIDGETLEDRVRREGPLGVDAALEIAVQVARALAAAADQGLVHRDVKPGNIMLSHPDVPTTLRATVIDFGLAKAVNGAGNGARSTHGGFIGTPAFASPEQFRGEPADARSDIYALGATLWFALTGRAPFTGNTMDELRDHPARAVLPVKQLTARKVPPPLVNVLRSALALDPAARPASTRELLTALEACRRRRGGRAMGTVLAVAALGIVAVLWWTDRRPPSMPAAVTDKSIAVLPFDNFSEDKNSAFFADGVQDEVLTDLAKVADLKVISRSSVMQYKAARQRNVREIGKALGVAYVVEGSVQRAGNKIRVTAQLIDARTDTHKWAEHYDRDLSDVFAIQSRIARQIAEQLRITLAPSERGTLAQPPTMNLKAYQLYVEAQFINAFDDMRGAEKSMALKVELLKEATRLDTDFALAYCALASTQIDFEDLVGDQTHLALARTAVDTALRLRPELGEVHRELARYFIHAKDFGQATDQLAIARRMLPNDAEVLRLAGDVESMQNHWDAAVGDLNKGHSLDPRDEGIVADLGWVYEALRQYGDWERLLRNFAPASAQQGYWIQERLAQIKLDDGDPGAAQAILDKVPLDDNTSNNIWFVRFDAALYMRDYAAARRVIAATPVQSPCVVFNGVYDGDPPQSWADGLVARLCGDEAKAKAAFTAARIHADAVLGDHPKDEWYYSQVSILDAELGRKDQAIAEAQAAVACLPIAKDALSGPWFAKNLALIYAWTGEHDLALKQLEILVRIPGFPAYGDLRFNPMWDALRGDPRFEAMTASLAPRQ